MKEAPKFLEKGIFHTQFVVQLTSTLLSVQLVSLLSNRTAFTAGLATAHVLLTVPFSPKHFSHADTPVVVCYNSKIAPYEWERDNDYLVIFW